MKGKSSPLGMLESCAAVALIKPEGVTLTAPALNAGTRPSFLGGSTVSTRTGATAGTTAGGGTGGGAPCGAEAEDCGAGSGSVLEVETFASTVVEVRIGLGAAGLASALVAFAVFPFAVFASLFPAMTGTAMTAIASRLNNHFFSFNIDDVSSFRLGSDLRPRTWGRNLRCFGWRSCDAGHITSYWESR